MGEGLSWTGGGLPGPRPKLGRGRSASTALRSWPTKAKTKGRRSQRKGRPGFPDRPLLYGKRWPVGMCQEAPTAPGPPRRRGEATVPVDRKSTRLNSSHSSISYAVFCLKKKKKKK